MSHISWILQLQFKFESEIFSELIEQKTRILKSILCVYQSFHSLERKQFKIVKTISSFVCDSTFQVFNFTSFKVIKQMVSQPEM